ncbi:MAG: ECF-type sigma factor [Thermoanaerobaculia bacterium]|nr:ECF-type sigma factor [Thermoanaerobaculia bacterium]
MPEHEITELLIAYREGDAGAFDRMVPLVYDDLRKIAHFHLRRRRRGATLDTTALVHEAYLKLADRERLVARDRSHFFAIASRAMRQVLIDVARKRAAKKRGSGLVAVPLEDVQVPVEEQAELLIAIDEALADLTARNERLTRDFECRHFGGLSEAETAEALSISLRTVQRDWMKSKAFLRRALGAPV